MDANTLPKDTGRKTRVLAAANGSAGSGKTTFVSAVGYVAATRGKKVLAVGMDKQRDLSHLLGYDDPDADENLATLFDVVDGICTIDETVVPALAGEGGAPIPNLWVIPESRKLEKLEFVLAGETARELWLHRQMPRLRGRFDIILLDCPGDMKLATTGALITADEIVGCVKSQEKEGRGLTELEDKLADVHEAYGHTGMRDEIDWVVIGESVSDKSQGKVYHDIEEQLREAYGDMVLKPSVRRDVKIPEAYTAQRPVTLYAPHGDAAKAYTEMGKKMKLYR
jgi:chromosome partitioning protein